MRGLALQLNHWHRTKWLSDQPVDLLDDLDSDWDSPRAKELARAFAVVTNLGNELVKSDDVGVRLEGKLLGMVTDILWEHALDEEWPNRRKV